MNPKSISVEMKRSKWSAKWRKEKIACLALWSFQPLTCFLYIFSNVRLYPARNTLNGFYYCYYSLLCSSKLIDLLLTPLFWSLSLDPPYQFPFPYIVLAQGGSHISLVFCLILHFFQTVVSYCTRLTLATSIKTRLCVLKQALE